MIYQRKARKIGGYAGGSLDNGWVFRTIHDEYNATESSAAVEVDFAPGCCLGIGRDVLYQIGLFDGSFLFIVRTLIFACG